MPDDRPQVPSQPEGGPAANKKTVEQRVLSRVLWAGGSVVAVIVVLGCLALAIPWEGFWPNAGQPFATVLGGLAVLGGGALALYNGRETRQSDQKIAAEENERIRELANTDHNRESLKELNARFAAAAAQLGNETAAIRLAGSYAMAALADDWRTQGNVEQTQVCIDVLCGYLRAEPTPEDSEVRYSILAAIKRRLQPERLHADGSEPALGPWSEMTFDFTSVTFNAADFADCRFARPATFTNATFAPNSNRTVNRTDFSRCVFSDTAIFDRSTFQTDEVSFANTVFEGREVSFVDTVFQAREVSFVAAYFKRTIGNINFKRAKFEASIELLSFEYAQFDAIATIFEQIEVACLTTNFEYLEFGGGTVSFMNAKFTGGETGFASSTFSAKVIFFDGATFKNVHGTSFLAARFKGPVVSFIGPRSWDGVRFDWDDDHTLMPPAVNPKPPNWPPTVQNP